MGRLRRGVDHRRRRSDLETARPDRATHEGFQFVQISDSHIGFNKPANADVNATLQIAIDKINALPKAPDFLIHTGDLTHLAKPSEFDTLEPIAAGRQNETDVLRPRRTR